VAAFLLSIALASAGAEAAEPRYVPFHSTNVWSMDFDNNIRLLTSDSVATSNLRYSVLGYTVTRTVRGSHDPVQVFDEQHYFTVPRSVYEDRSVSIMEGGTYTHYLTFLSYDELLAMAYAADPEWGPEWSAELQNTSELVYVVIDPIISTRVKLCNDTDDIDHPLCTMPGNEGNPHLYRRSGWLKEDPPGFVANQGYEINEFYYYDLSTRADGYDRLRGVYDKFTMSDIVNYGFSGTSIRNRFSNIVCLNPAITPPDEEETPYYSSGRPDWWFWNESWEGEFDLNAETGGIPSGEDLKVGFGAQRWFANREEVVKTTIGDASPREYAT
jgi:hypothetical protein